MAFLIAEPDLMTTAAADLAGIRSGLGAANSAAAGAIAGLLPAAADEVSSATAALFNAYAQEYQSVVDLASAFHDQFARSLAGSGLAYLEAEAANVVASASGALRSAFTGGVANSAATTTLIMGASGYPIPWENPAYIPIAVANYIESIWGPAGTVLPIATPEGLYPLTGIKDLTFDVSAARGLSILNEAIQSAVASGSTQINVFGYSQSAAIASMQMMALNPTNTPGGSLLPGGTTLNFTLVGNVSNPNGGLLARFPGLSLPSLGFTLGLATPANSFPTHIYTIEYDGFADFPRYPLNVVSDLNAFMGIIELHGNYGNYDPSQAIQLTNTVGPTQTEYYIYPTKHLPLLSPLRAIPVVGGPLANLIEPNMRVLVNLGYGSTTQGWSPDPPNVHTPFGVLPPVSPGEIASALDAGTQQGVSAFVQDINHMFSGPPADPVSGLTGALGSFQTGGANLVAPLSSPVTFISALQSANSNFFNAVSTSASAGYATLLPTADIATSLVTSVPSYNINLFLSGVEQMIEGDPVNGLIYALGAPLAANTALAVLFAGFEIRVLQHALSTIISAWAPPATTAAVTTTGVGLLGI